MRKDVAELLNERKRLSKELSEVERKLESIWESCPHENKIVLDRYQEPGSGRTMYDYKCLDCGLVW
jgi:hypothetical protein